MNRKYRKTVIAGNWKMNKTPSAIQKTILKQVQDAVAGKVPATARMQEFSYRPYLSSRQAMPGSSRPSRNSREAPPPVEMWVILSA